MTDTDRARLERAQAHRLCRDAMARSPQDYSVPVALLAAFYILIPLLFLLPMLIQATGDSARNEDILVVAVFFAGFSLSVIPFLIGVLRTWPLRSKPARHALGIIADRLARKPGAWIRLETLDGPVELRLRLKAYLESTGGGVAPGSVGVALCKGDQLVEWVDIPDVSTPG